MTIEAPVKPTYPHIVGAPWKLDGHFGWHNAASVDINSIAVDVVAGHRYRVTVNAAGYLRSDTGVGRTYQIKCGTEILVSLLSKMDRGNFAGLAYLPISLVGEWVAATSGSASFVFNMERQDHTLDQDWELSTNVHQMWVEDIGP